MIYNERQYKITAKQLSELRANLENYQVEKEPEWLAAARKAALSSQISELEAELVEYDLIKRGEVNYYERSGLSSLPKALIAARIARGMSQKDLADVLGMSAQQIQRYEATNYMGASLLRLIEVARVLDVKISESWAVENSESGDVVYAWQDSSSVDWNKFPIKEMMKRGWLSVEHKQSPVEAVKGYFSKSAGMEYASAFHRKKFHGNNKPNEYSLLAWQARVLEKAKYEHSQGLLGNFEYQDAWLPELVGVSREKHAPLIAKSILADHGIALVIEPHLEKTYLDGAAMYLDTGNPVIALTLRHDRLDNFWFVLMHELGHVFSAFI